MGQGTECPGSRGVRDPGGRVVYLHIVLTISR